MEIWKYALTREPRQILQVPLPGVPLSVALQEGGQIVLWVRVNPTAAVHPLVVHLIPTGEPLPATLLAFVGTVQVYALTVPGVHRLGGIHVFGETL